MAERVPHIDLSVAHKIEAPDLTKIESFLKKEIHGQPQAAEFWASALHSILSKSPKLRNGPLAVVTEVGPSGVGKTEMVKKVAQYLAEKDTPPKLIRVDCGEFQQEHEVAKILGAPPGYRGGEIVPRLAQSEITREGITLKDGRNITILLFDEIEKANPKLSTALLGALDYGKLTLGDNSTVNLANCIVVFTSNLGNKEIASAQSAGLTPTAAQKNKMRNDAMLAHFTPEQLSRMGGESGTIVFEELSREVMSEILLSKLTLLEDKYGQQGIKVKVLISNKAVETILDLGHSVREGARRLEHVIEQEIISRLSGAGEKINNSTIMIDSEESGIVLYASRHNKAEDSPEVVALEKIPVSAPEVALESKGDQREKQGKSFLLDTLETIKVQIYPFALFRHYKNYLARLGALVYAYQVRSNDAFSPEEGSSFWVYDDILEKTRKGEIPDHFWINLEYALWDKERLGQPGTTEKFAREVLSLLFNKMGEMLIKSIKEKDKDKSKKTKHIESLLAGALNDHPEALISFFRETFKWDLKKYDEY